MANVSKDVTRVYSRKIKPGYERQYDDWLRRYLEYQRHTRGYLGTTVIVPGGTNSTLRYIVHRFADNDSLDEWERSEQAIKMLEEVNKYSTRNYETATGLETWFTVPDMHAMAAPPPKKWKMAILVFVAAFAISTIARYLLNPYLEASSHLVSSVLYTAILVLLLTYLVMPALSNLLRNWLYPENGKLFGLAANSSSGE